jgi:hypothetical protein
MKKKSYMRAAVRLAILVISAHFLLAVNSASAKDEPAPPALMSPGVELAVHGGFQLDYIGFDDGEDNLPGAGSQQNDMIVRRARFIMEGKILDEIGFFMQTGLELSDVPIMDAVVTIPVAPWLDLRAGQMKTPFSAERLRAYKHQPFMERSLASSLELRRSQGVVLRSRPWSGAVETYLGLLTGESMNRNNTDDHFEYAGRVVLNFDSMLDGFPGAANAGFSAAHGKREPESSATDSFPGKTLNRLTYFSPVPVSGYRTRYETDFEWRYESFWIAAEWIGVIEERDNVTVELDIDSDRIGDDTVTRDLDPLYAQGWTVYAVWVMTGEPAAGVISPAGEYGAWSLALRYSTITFDSSEELIPGSISGTRGREVSEASEALGRPDIEETVRELYAGIDWDIKYGVFFQAATVWQWFDHSSPYANSDRSDVNYRARIGVIF